MDWQSSDSHDRNCSDKNQFKIFNKFKEKISQLVYRYGLFCSSHPWLVMTLSIIIFIIGCYPFIRMQLASPSSHQTFITNKNDVFFDQVKFILKNSSSHIHMYRKSPHEHTESLDTPRWFESTSPFVFIQQILVKSAVIPWQKNLILMDAIRGPLGRVFQLKEFISNRQFQFNGKSHTLSDYCMQVFEPVSLTVRGTGTNSQTAGSTSESLLPRYSCLLISPGNFWHNDQDKFSQDPSILKTLHEIHHEGLVPTVSIGHLREVLFGVPWKETGIRKMYLTTRQRTITYAVTVILSKYDPEFINSLKEALEERYPLYLQPQKLHPKVNNVQSDPLNKVDTNGNSSQQQQKQQQQQSSDRERGNNSSHMSPPSALSSSSAFSSSPSPSSSQSTHPHSTSNGLDLSVTNSNHHETSDHPENIIHLYFQVKISYTEYILRATMYLLVFLYVLFSVRKIDLIKCKWALALGSVLTGIMTFLMSFGICLWLDLNFVPSKSDALPYIVSLVGLESMLVLTNSVVSTPAHLDIRVRIAQGLSKEAWPTMRMLLFELSSLLIGYLTYVPVIQEFCLFGFAALLADIFLQVTFFTAILSIDIQRLEIQEKEYLNTSKLPLPPSNSSSQVGAFANSINGRIKHQRNNSEFNINSQTQKSNGLFNSRHSSSSSIQLKLPKRLRFVYFIARTRVVRRTLVVCMVIWISYLLCDSGLTDHFTTGSVVSSNVEHILPTSSASDPSLSPKSSHPPPSSPVIPHATSQGQVDPLATGASSFAASSITSKFDGEFHLTPNHWQSLFSCYNISLAGKYLSILPPIKLVIPIDPSDALRSRNPSESDPQIFRQFLPASASASLGDLVDEMDYEENGTIPDSNSFSHWDHRQICMLVALSLPLLFILFYAVYILYKVCCSRNYAEWRTSWSQVFKSFWSLNFINFRQSTPENSLEFDVSPITLPGHSEEIELVTSNLESPYLASTCIQGDLIVWDVCSGLSQVVIKRHSKSNSTFVSTIASGGVADEQTVTIKQLGHDAVSTTTATCTLSQSKSEVHLSNNVYSSPAITLTTGSLTACTEFRPEHRQSDSFSSDSTYGSSPSTTGSALSESNLESPSSSVISATPVTSIEITGHSSSFSFATSRASVNKNRFPSGHRRHHSTSSIFSLASGTAPSALGTLNSSISPSPRTHFNSNELGTPGAVASEQQKQPQQQQMTRHDLNTSSSAYSPSPVTFTMNSSEFNASQCTPSTMTRINSSRELLTDLIRSVVHTSNATANAVSSSTSSPVAVGPSTTVTTTTADAVGCGSASGNTPNAGSYSSAGHHEIHHGSSVQSNCIDSPLPFKSIWTMEMYANRIYIGCENGRIEIWEVPSGALVYHHEHKNEGVTGIKVTHSKMFLAHLDGVIEMYQLEPPSTKNHISAPGISYALPYAFFRSLRSHRQPISVVEVTPSHLVTGSIDHLIKVHTIDTGAVVYTLHGHFGAISSLEIDPGNSSTAYSGCSTGQICVWDLNTGTCIFSLEGHPGASVSTIVTTPLYFVSLGTDDKILIWDKYSGNLVHKISSHHTFCKNLALLSTNILVSAKDNTLVLYDISEGTIIRVIDLSNLGQLRGDGNSQQRTNLLTLANGADVSGVLIKNLRICSSSRSLVCDYGSHLCIFHFPGIAQKFD